MGKVTDQFRELVVVGAGSIGQRHAANLCALWPDARVSVVSASGRSLDAVPGNNPCTFAEALARRPDFAIIASPAPWHVDHALQFIRAGVPVLIEKPLSDRLTPLESLIDEVQSGAFVSVAYCLRYLPSAQTVKQAVAAQRIGRVLNVQASVGQHLYQWRPGKPLSETVSAQARLGGGVLTELSHELDYLQWLFGPLKVTHSILQPGSTLNIDVEEAADLMLTSEKGVVCQLHLDFLQATPYRHCSILGTDGQLHWDLLANRVECVTSKGHHLMHDDAHWDKGQMYTLMLKEVASAIRNQAPPPIPAREGHAVVALIEQARSLNVRGERC